MDEKTVLLHRQACRGVRMARELLVDRDRWTLRLR
jgi:hypothetical protein